MKSSRQPTSSGRPSGSGRNVLFTGVPRSGTTLSCHLLNKVPNTVALHEPMHPGALVGLRDAEVLTRIEQFCRSTRDSVVRAGTAPSKQVEGKVPDNPIASAYSGVGVRQRLVSQGVVRIEQPVDGNFTLVVKHPGLFTNYLEALLPRYPLFAIIRNPLSVLCSWNSVPLKVSGGRVPGLERLNPKLAAALAGISDVIDRQLYILCWYFERYRGLLAEAQVLRYEELVASRGRLLSVAVPAAAELDEPLENRNKSQLYAEGTMRRLADRLLATDGPYWSYYSREAVARLIEPASAPAADSLAVA